MSMIKRLVVLFSVTMVLYCCSLSILFITHWFDLGLILSYVKWFYLEDDGRLTLAFFTCFVLFFNFLFYRLFSVNVHKEKTVAFDNPSGRVCVSLTALEDLLRRKITQDDDVKDAKIKIQATRKGLVASVRLDFCAEINVPEVTSRIQEIVRNKAHDVIGLEEKVEVQVFVGKITPAKPKSKPVEKKEEEPEGHDPHVPFQGYRA